MGLLQPESGLLFWMVISFGVVFVLLAKFGFPVITRMVEERRVYVEKSLEAAKQANEQLAGIKSESEALLQKAREEQMRILNEAAAAKQRIIEECSLKPFLKRSFSIISNILSIGIPDVSHKNWLHFLQAFSKSARTGK